MGKTKKQKQQDEALFMALAKKDSKSILEALRSGADLKATTEEGWGVLHFLAYTGNVKMLEGFFKMEVFKKSVDIDAKTNDDSTALIIAAARGHKEVCEFLIDHKAKINHQDRLGQTALLGAVDIGDEHVVRLLLRSGADLTKKYIDKEALSIQSNEKILEESGGEVDYEFDILRFAQHKAQVMQAVSKPKALIYQKMLSILEEAFLEHEIKNVSRPGFSSL